MPTLIGAAVIALGGAVLLRLARREWARVNQTMQAQRSAPKQDPQQDRGTKTLRQDPQTGAYRPVDE